MVTLYLDETHNYYYQVQGQMLCSGRDECDFVIYTLEDIKIIRIVKNDQFIADMTQKLASFNKDHFRNVVLDKFFYHDYSKYDFSR